jgi:hypothetical protein
MGGSGTVNLKAQNVGINTLTVTYPGGSIVLNVRKGLQEESITINSSADETVIILTETVIQVST